MAKKPKKMTVEELAAAATQQMEVATSRDSSKLSKLRANAMGEYLGRPYGDEVADRSGVVTREVMETVEWAMPQLLRIFQGGETVVQFEPQGPEDVAEAEQATDYCNYIYNRANPGFKITYQWIKDGLIQKNGIVKIRWDESETEEREEYESLSMEELDLLLSDDKVQVEGEIEMVEGPMPSFNVAVLRTLDEGKTVVENVPPEEFFISRNAKDIQSAPFVAHQTMVTKSELKAMGYKVDELPTASIGPQGGINSQERLARFRDDDTGGDRTDTQISSDETTAEVALTECYMRVDFDGDGISELRQIMMVGNEVLEYTDKKDGKYANKEVNWTPFAGWTPIIMSHKFYGLSLGELVSDLQRIKSQLFRNMLDNQYIANHGKYEVLEGMVNLDDMMTARPHGIVRSKMAGAVRRIDVPQLGPTAFDMLGTVDQMAERRSGVSSRTQGLDEDQLNPNTAASAVNQVMTAAQQRIELIARVFGETGFTDLFNLIYATENKFQKNEKIVRLRNTYVNVDPGSWRERKDLSVVVGLGNGSKDSQLYQLNGVFQNQMQLLNAGKGNLVGDINLYNTLNDQAKLYNIASDNRYFQDPNSPEAQQQAQQQQQEQQKQQQMQEQMMQVQVQLAQQQLQLEQMKAQAKAEDDAHNTQRKDKELELATEVAIHDATIDYAEIGLEAEQDRPVGIGD